MSSTCNNDRSVKDCTEGCDRENRKRKPITKSCREQYERLALKIMGISDRIGRRNEEVGQRV